MSNYLPCELHTHTYHSDGSMSPKKLIKQSIKRGYKGIGITDHNTCTSYDEINIYAENTDLVILKGIEWTTFWGHFTVFGLKNQIDWREITLNNIDEIIQEANSQGAIVNIAHPKRMGAPFCAGCYMEYPIKQFENITCFEIWSSASPHKERHNLLAVNWFYQLLDEGHKLTAIYGYDWHQEDEGCCYATTFVGGEPSNDKEVIKSLKMGDTFVSIGLIISLKINGEQIPFGCNIEEGCHSLSLEIKEFDKEFCTKFKVKPQKILIKGSAVKETFISIEEANDFSLEVTQGYFVIEILGEIEGEKENNLLFTSPIYVERRIRK